MREAVLLQQPAARRSVRSRVSSAVADRLPVWVFRKMMESQFINFGVETTNICNANCSFCAYRYMERPKTVMPWEVFEAAVTEFSKAGGGSINFTPTVGDPLVDKRLLDKIHFAASLPNIGTIFLYTNGILLHRFGFDEVLTSGITRLAISTFVGSREGYRTYYGKNKYDQVIKNIEGIARRNRERGSPVKITLHLRVAKDQREWRETETFRTLAELIGLENIDFLTIYGAWSGKIDKDDLPPGCELDEPLPVEVKKREPCFELYRRVHVLANGNVGACVCADLDAEINIGNIRENSLQEIWKGERLARYRGDWVTGNLPEVCKGCTRYTPLSQFIDENRRRILIDYIRRSFPRLFRAVTNRAERTMTSHTEDV